MPTVAVVSSNKELVRFFELEIKSCGYACEIFRSCSAISDNPALIFADMDTVKLSDTFEGSHKIIYISEERPDKKYLSSWISWPAPVEEIRNFITGLNVNPTRTLSIDHTDCIYVEDQTTGLILLGSRQIKLSKAEFMVLCALCRADGEYVPRAEITELLGATKGNIADVYICHLRKKLEGAQGRHVIFTERSKGYRTSLKLVE